MDGVLRTLGMLLFGCAVTWFLSVFVGRLISKRGVVFWVWDRSGSIGRILVLAGFGLAVLGFTQGNGAAGTSLVAFGSLAGMAGIWLILPGP